MDWWILPSDLWISIGSKLDVADRVRLSAASKTFQSYLPFRQPIWLMLPEENYTEELPEEATGEDLKLLFEQDYYPPQINPPRCRFIPLGEQHIHRWDLPEAHMKRCVFSIPGGWILTVDYDGTVCLLNVFTRRQIELPSLYTIDDVGLLEMLRDGRLTVMNAFLRKIVFSSTDFINFRDWTAMVTFDHYNALAIRKPGDASWTNLGNSFNDFDDIIYFKEKFYLVNHCGCVSVYNNKWRDIVTQPIDDPADVGSRHWRKYYLAEWMGELLLVERLCPVKGEYTVINGAGMVDPYSYQNKKTLGFNVFKIDFTKGDVVELNNLGDYSLFVGLNTSVSVSMRNYATGSLQRNCIYFSPDRLHQPDFSSRGLPQLADDIGVYSLEDKSIQYLYHGISSPSCPPPVWIIPTLDQNQ